MIMASLYEEYGMLQERLRVLILQHRSEEMDYDDFFLQEMQSISRKLLELKRQMRSVKKQPMILQSKGKKSRRVSYYQS